LRHKATKTAGNGSEEVSLPQHLIPMLSYRIHPSPLLSYLPNHLPHITSPSSLPLTPPPPPTQAHPSPHLPLNTSTRVPLLTPLLPAFLYPPCALSSLPFNLAPFFRATPPDYSFFCYSRPLSFPLHLSLPLITIPPPNLLFLPLPPST